MSPPLDRYILDSDTETLRSAIVWTDFLINQCAPSLSRHARDEVIRTNDQLRMLKRRVEAAVAEDASEEAPV